MLEPPKIKLGAGLKSVTSIGNSFIATAPSERKSEIRASPVSDANLVDNVPVFDVFEDESFGIPQSETFLSQLLGSVRHNLQGSGWSIVDIDHKEYHEIYTIQRACESERISIWYNAKGKVTQITPIGVSSSSPEITDLLAPLKLRLFNGSNVAPEVVFSKEYLNHFHQRLMGLVNSADITLISAEEQQWALRYTFCKGNAVAVFDINFNGKQQFTKKSVLRNKSMGVELISEIDLILTEGLSL